MGPIGDVARDATTAAGVARDAAPASLLATLASADYAPPEGDLPRVGRAAEFARFSFFFALSFRLSWSFTAAALASGKLKSARKRTFYVFVAVSRRRNGKTIQQHGLPALSTEVPVAIVVETAGW